MTVKTLKEFLSERPENEEVLCQLNTFTGKNPLPISVARAFHYWNRTRIDVYLPEGITLVDRRPLLKEQ